MDFQIYDFPGQLDFAEATFDDEEVFGEIGAMVWVIDAQDDWTGSITRLNRTIIYLQQTHPHISIEVFIHKIDCLSEDRRADTFSGISLAVHDELHDHGVVNAPISFYLTSIYDYTVFEAFSKVIQKLVPTLPALENILNNVAQTCAFEKLYLFDVLSKIYVATDASPSDMLNYELLADFIDMVVDMSDQYNYDRSKVTQPGDGWHQEEGQMRLAPKQAESCMQLWNGDFCYLFEVNK